MENYCEGGVCYKCRSSKILIIGVLVLINAYYAKYDWALFVGWLLVVKGILHMMWPACPHCKMDTPKKRR